MPKLADQERYLASKSSFYRIMRADGLHHRGRAKPPMRPKPPTSYNAGAPCEVWTWDIAWMPGPALCMKSFASWYNGEHLHSAIRFVTPNARHAGRDCATLANRAVLYANARAQNPER